jgi:hypothetical protein
LWLGQHLVRIPARTKNGVYKWELFSESSNILSFGSIEIKEPIRIFNPPNVSIVSQVSFDDTIFLYGYETNGFETPNDLLKITLVWKPTKTPYISLNSFIHIENSSGDLVAQHDSVPGGWVRPSQGWIPNEYIIDEHTLQTEHLDVNDEYRVYIGLYEKETGKRLVIHKIDQAGDRLLLGSFVVN